MKAHIPNSAFLGNINTFLSGLETSKGDCLQITINPKWISIHPLVLSIIAALGKPLDPKKISCEEILAPSGHYLETMGLFKFLGIHPKVKKIQKHEPTGRLIPLRQIKNSKDLDKFLKDLVPLLHLEKEPKQVEAIQHIFSELIRNVLEHADSKLGAVACAQYFKASNKIAIGVADIGKGLKKTLSKSYLVKDDLEAIKLALTPGVTGTTKRPGGSEQNAGFGLFLIKSIAHINSDFFTIMSGNKFYKLLRRGEKQPRLRSDPFQDKHSIINVAPWQGVAVGVDISLSQTAEFVNLLNSIYGFYSKEIKNVKKERFKSPKFI